MTDSEFKKFLRAEYTDEFTLMELTDEQLEIVSNSNPMAEAQKKVTTKLD